MTPSNINAWHFELHYVLATLEIANDRKKKRWWQIKYKEYREIERTGLWESRKKYTNTTEKRWQRPTIVMIANKLDLAHI